MLVSEIFPTIQGEGLKSGFPFTIIRLSGCNLRCIYCDTKYAWEDGKDVTLEDIIKEAKNIGIKNVLITGGEPLLQVESVDLMKKLLDEGFEVSLETNGSLSIYRVPRNVHIVMDIKTPGSGEGDSFLWENLKFLKPTDEVKIVIVDRRDYEWAKGILDKLEGFTVNFSPAHGILDPGELARWIIEDRIHVRFNLQIHKYIGVK